MNDLLLFGGIALAVYVLWPYLAGVSTPVAQTVSTTSSGATTPAPTGITIQQLQAAAGGDVMLNADQWNFYYSQLSGVHQTTDLFTPGNRGELISAATYMARRAAKGLTGLWF